MEELCKHDIRSTIRLQLIHRYRGSHDLWTREALVQTDLLESQEADC